MEAKIQRIWPYIVIEFCFDHNLFGIRFPCWSIFWLCFVLIPIPITTILIEWPLWQKWRKWPLLNGPNMAINMAVIGIITKHSQNVDQQWKQIKKMFLIWPVESKKYLVNPISHRGEGVWKVSGWCLNGVWMVSGWCPDGVWKVSGPKFFWKNIFLSLIHIWRCRRYSLCRSRWSPYH